MARSDIASRPFIICRGHSGDDFYRQSHSEMPSLPIQSSGPDKVYFLPFKKTVPEPVYDLQRKGQSPPWLRRERRLWPLATNFRDIYPYLLM